MSASDPSEQLSARIAATGARTAQLLGVDFVPLKRTRRQPVEAGVVERVEPSPVRPVVASSASAAAPAHEPGEGLRSSRAARLERLRARYEADAPHAQFVTDHHSIVFGEGDPCATVMFVGEAPGAEEDRTGRPFVGKAGQLLDKMIVAMKLTREGVYIANVLKTRPPGNATPTSREADLCRPYLIEQILTVRPRFLVTLGLPATRTLLRSEEAMGKLRGRFVSVRFEPSDALDGTGRPLEGEAVGGHSVEIMPTYHPAYLLRDYTPENRAKVWSDLKQVMDRL